MAQHQALEEDATNLLVTTNLTWEGGGGEGEWFVSTNTM